MLTICLMLDVESEERIIFVDVKTAVLALTETLPLGTGRYTAAKLDFWRPVYNTNKMRVK